MDASERVALEACRQFQLSRDVRRLQGPTGSSAGVGVGSSVEFHDFRDYVLGDDLRHVDWAVYGRTGSLTVRLFREEVNPGVEIILDASRSMAIDDGRKAELARELAWFARCSGQLLGGSVRLHLAGVRSRRVELFSDLQLAGESSVLLAGPEGLARELRRGTLRIVISDLLGPGDPNRALRALAANAAQLVVLMTWGPWEADPMSSAMQTLIDAERRLELSTALADATLRRYQQRLSALRQGVIKTCAQLGARFAPVVCDRPLLRVLRDDLLPAGVVAPA